MVSEAIVHENGHAESSKKIADFLKGDFWVITVPLLTIFMPMFLVFYGVI